MTTHHLELDDYDLRLLMHAMKCYRRELDKKRRRNERAGWQPEPGHGDRVSGLRERWEELDARLRSI